MKKHILTPIAFFFFSVCLFAQSSTINSSDKNWLTMMKDGKANVHSIQKAFYSWYAEQKKDTEATQGAKEEDCAYTLFKRWEWLMEPRTYPSGNYPDPAIITTEYTRLLKKNTDRETNTESMANWTYEGNDSVPDNGGDGRINHVRFYPGNNNIMYACAPTGGLWKTTNGGATWSTNTDQLTELGTSDIAIDPKNPNIMYLATGDCDGPGADFRSISTIGILKSTDGGNTWSPTGLSYSQANTGPSYGTITELAINPTNTSIILAATSAGMYYSANAGNSWTQADTCYFRSVEFEPFHPSIVYASTNNGKFFRSTNGGQSYSQITSGLPSPGLTARTTIAVSPADSNDVYVVFEDVNSWSYYGLYLSHDRGQNFTQQSNSNVGTLGMSYGWYGLPLAVSPTNVDTILTGGVDLYMSTDGGITWSKNASWTGSGAPYAHADSHHIIFTPGTGASWYDACDGGIFKATKGGKVYTDISHNLRIAEIYALGPSSLSPGKWLTGWQDNGTNLSGLPWQQVNGGDGMVPFIDYSNDNTMYSATQDGALYRSYNSGASWNYIASGISENGPWVTRWLQDPQNTNTLFAGYSNIWKSTNKGNSWTEISSFSSASNKIYALIIDPANDKVLYAAWPDSIFSTSNQVNWKNITSTLPVSAAWITGITLDPVNYLHAWVTFSGYVDSVKVFRTFDGGTTWKNISAGLPNLPVNCILFQKNSYSGVYVGTDAGIYYRDTLSNKWISYNKGLPNVMVNDLKYDANGNLLAATYGRGVWESPAYDTSAVLGVAGLNVENGELKVLPNPNDGRFTIESSGANSHPDSYQESVVEIYNMLGERVYSRQWTINYGQWTINLSGQSSGIYLYRVTSKDDKLIGEGKLIIR